MFYWAGDADSAANSGNTEELGLAAIFVRLSLGNIGQNFNAGGEANYLAEAALQISCPFGTLDSLDAFGLSKDNEANARMMADSTAPGELLEVNCALVGDDLTLQATTQTLFASSADAKAVATCFEQTCRNKRSCAIALNDTTSCFPKLPDSLGPTCRAIVALRDKYSRYSASAAVPLDPSKTYEPVFLAQATCMPGMLVMPLIGVKIEKESFGIFIVVIDLIVIMTIVCFIYLLDVM